MEREGKEDPAEVDGQHQARFNRQLGGGVVLMLM